jgi:hypothetical protein
VTALVDVVGMIDERGAVEIVAGTAEGADTLARVGLVPQVPTVIRPRAREDAIPRRQAAPLGAADVTHPCQLPRDHTRGPGAIAAVAVAVAAAAAAADGMRLLTMIAAAHQARDAIGDAVVRRSIMDIVEASSEVATDLREVAMLRGVKLGEEIVLRSLHAHPFEANLLMVQKIHRDPTPPPVPPLLPSRLSPRRTTKRLVHIEGEGDLLDGSACELWPFTNHQRDMQVHTTQQRANMLKEQLLRQKIVKRRCSAAGTQGDGQS